MTSGSTDFQQWLSHHHAELAAQYRFELDTVVRIWSGVCEGMIIDQAAVNVALHCLRVIPVPKLPEAPEYRTPENIALYNASHKPDWEAMRKEREEVVTKKLTK